MHLVFFSPRAPFLFPKFKIQTSFIIKPSSISMSSLSSAVDSHMLVLGGKSTVEVELAKLIQRTNALNFPDTEKISTCLHLESGSLSNSFNIDTYMNLLSTTYFGRFLIWSPKLHSTHDIVSSNFSELPVGSVCLADIQYKGRGRSKNVWESPPGCLMFSFTIQMEDGRVVPLLQYVVSLAVTEAIKDVCNAKDLPHIDVRIKWPNDLYLNGQKVGGILCTSTYKSKKFNVSAGIGLNVDNKEPTTCLNSVLQELSSGAHRLVREEILAAFFNRFESFFNLFMSQGFRVLEDLYYKTWLHSGQKVVVREDSKDQLVETVVTIQGLTSFGYLLAVGEDNEVCELHPDGNSFDFFKGLLRRKLQ